MKGNKNLQVFHKLPAMVRLLVALTLSATAFYLFKYRSGHVQFMTVWICFALSNLLMYVVTMFTAHPGEISLIAKNQDTSITLILLVTIIASSVSLFAIIFLLQILPNANEPGYYLHSLLSIGSVACSWFLIHTTFTFHYAHLYYTCKSDEDTTKREYLGGLEFPNDRSPDYFDFAYFSFGIGMTFQVSDVVVSSSSTRRLVLLHSLLSFLFNTVLLALSINIIAGLVQK